MGWVTDKGTNDIKKFREGGKVDDEKQTPKTKGLVSRPKKMEDTPGTSAWSEAQKKIRLKRLERTSLYPRRPKGRNPKRLKKKSKE